MLRCSAAGVAQDRPAGDQFTLYAAQAGDVEAFNRLVSINQTLVYNVAFRILGDGDAAADVTQEAFLSAHRAIRQFRGGSFRAWLCRIVTNACYDELRRQRRPVLSLDDIEEVDRAPYLLDPAGQPEAYAERRELRRLLQAGIGALPPDQRLVLVLADVQGLKYREVAAATGLAIGTVKSRLNRARSCLRDYLVRSGRLPSAALAS